MALTRITKGVIKPNENYDTHDINSTGIITATGGNITGNLTVGGVLTYEDVSSIDSVGIITANQGIHVGSGISAVGIVTSAAVDVDDFLDVGSNIKLGNAGVITATSYRGDGSQLTGIVAGLTTISGAVNVANDLDVDGHTDLDNLNVAGITTIGAVNQTVYTPHNTNWATRSAINLLGNYGGGLAFNDNNNNGFVQHVSGSGVDFWLKNGAVGGALATSLKATKGQAIELYYNGTKRFETTNTGSTISGTVVATGADINGDIDVSGNITGSGDLTLTDTTADSAAGPELKLFRNSASPADADYLGQIKFAGESDTGVERNYAKITGKILDASNGTEDGIIEIAHIKAGSQNISARFRSDSLQLINNTNFTVNGSSELQDLDVDGHTNLDNVSIAGVSTFSGAVSINSSGYPLTLQASNSTIPAIRINNQSGSLRGQILANDHLNVRAYGNDIIFSPNAGGGTSGDNKFDTGNVEITNDLKVGTAVTITSAGAGFYAGIVTASNFVKRDGSAVGGVQSDAQYNTVGGSNAGDSIASGGTNNTAFGYNAITAVTTGDDNTAVGFEAGLQAGTSVFKNTYIGGRAGRNNTGGTRNTYVGYDAGKSHTGNTSVCIGYLAGQSTIRTDVTCVGASAGQNASEGTVCIGAGSAYNPGGIHQVFVGKSCGGDISGDKNALVGYTMFGYNSGAASNNSGIGYGAAWKCTGSNNCVVGTEAMENALAASNNSVLGYKAGDLITTGDNNIVIGASADPSSATVSNEITLGDANIDNFRIPGIGVSFGSSGEGYFSGIVTATSYRGDGSQLTGISQVGGASTVSFNNNVPIYFGDNNDYKIYFNSSKMSFEPTHSGTQQFEMVSNNQMYIKSKASGLFLVSGNQNVIDIYGGSGGGIYFKWNNSEKLKLEGGNWTYLNNATVSNIKLGGILDGNGQTANFTANNTGLGIPIGTDANEPSASSYKGYIRYNDDDDVIYYSNGTIWQKISAKIAVLSSISGDIYSGTTSNLTLTGTGFLSSNLVVNFVQSSDSINANVTVTPSSDTAATVAVPAAVYNNVTAGNAVTIKVTNSDSSTSGTVNKTALALPSGGSIYTSGGYRYHKFTSSGTFTQTISRTVEYLIVAGGGAGGGSNSSGNRLGGGGGAGGLRGGSVSTTAQGYSIIIGAGGSGVTASEQANGGSNSSALGVTSIGGGGGGSGDSSSPGYNGGNGGSGGGAGRNGSGGSGTSGQGNDGGNHNSSSNPRVQGGGGGASAAGNNGSNNGSNGNGYGGAGSNAYSTWASATSSGASGYYAGGGGGGWHGSYSPATRALGGAGGGGNGGDSTGDNSNAYGKTGTANTGGGGGGNSTTAPHNGVSGAPSGPAGGSGIVIIRYQL